MSLFPSLLSLSNHQNHQQQTIPSSPTKGNNNNNTDSTTIENINNSQQRKSSTNSSPSHQRFGGNNSTINNNNHSQQSVTPRSASGSRRGSTVDDRGAFCTLPQQGGNQPEVLVSLCYFDTQNRLVVGVNKAAAIGIGRKKESGSDVSGQEVSIRISAFSAEGVEIGKQKSAWTKSSPTGEVQFNDAQASFQISRHELEECAIQVDMFGLNNSAWPPLLRRKQKIGTLMLSDRRENDCSSSSDAQAHWQEMIQGMGLTLDKWHLLD
uniref:C2 domain-containing protein n=1 Tax=Meloidogyne hapla TaxID=6305 RepID=A0A1I8BDG0_MELHA